jgi:hypothetical protein
MTRQLTLPRRGLHESDDLVAPSNISLNVFCGYGRPNAVDVERDLLRKIIKAEVGGL